MFIILVSYLVLIWLAFSKFKLIRLTWSSGTVAALAGIAILAVFMAMLNYLTPNGRVVVVSRVVEVTPNVSGEVIAIPVKPNVPVKADAVLFEIDPTPFRYKVRQLEAALIAAQHQAEVLKANYDQANANVAGLEKQVAFHEKRLNDIASLKTAEPPRRFVNRTRASSSILRLPSCSPQRRNSRARGPRSNRRSAVSTPPWCRPMHNSMMQNGSLSRRRSRRRRTATPASWRSRSVPAPCRRVRRCPLS